MRKDDNNELSDYYYKNEHFREFVDKLMIKHKLSLREALRWALTWEMYDYLLEEEQDKITRPVGETNEVFNKTEIFDDKCC